MNPNIFLRKPSVEWLTPYLDFYEEWKASQESFVPWVIGKDPEDFEAYVQFLNEGADESKLADGFVPHSTYWLMDSSHRILGAVNIRHQLNQKLLESGGHIGYGIRPSERRKGYASELLRQSLQITRDLGLEQVLVVCDQTNTASERTILKNGGVLESEFIEADGNVVRRHWITLSQIE
jgi:predicted acetyltransferase